MARCRRSGPSRNCKTKGLIVIDEVKGAVTEGTWALFLMSSSGVQDRISQRFIGTELHLIAPNLGPDQEAKLREALGQE
jgi:uncharacterized membrane protein